MKNKDEYFKKIALQYIEVEGDKLKEEWNRLEKEDGNHTKMDQDISHKIKTLKRKKQIRWAGALVACSMLFLLSYSLIGQRNLGEKGSMSESSNQIIPLNATLPANYTIANVEQDKGETLYYIKNTNKEDVVISISRLKGAMKTSGLDQMSIDNKTIYGQKEKDYSILKFEKDGNVFVLTCKSDLDVLLELSKNILS